MGLAVEDDVLVYLIRHHMQAVVEGQGLKAAQIVVRPHRAGWVVRRIEDYQPGSRRDGLTHVVPIDAVGGRLERNVPRHAAGKPHRRLIAVVSRIEQDDLVAGPHHRGNRAEQRFGSAGGHRDLRLGIRREAVQIKHLAGDRLAQALNPRHGRILVVAVGEVVLHPFQQIGRPVEIREALGQVQGTLFRSQRRHDGEYGGADFGQLAVQAARRGVLCHGQWTTASWGEGGFWRTRTANYNANGD